MMATLTAFLDASVMYPAPLRDFLMVLAVNELFNARWSQQVHQEWLEAVLRNRPDLTRSQLERTQQLMNSHIADALVDSFEHLINGLSLPDPDDRHVLAAAIKSNTTVIVTCNLKDFPQRVLSPLQI